MNELQKRAKYHRKRQKGMSPFYSPDGGNCILPDYGNSTSISTFNNSTSGSTPTSGMAEDYLQKPFNDDGSQLSRQELLNRIKCWYPNFNEYLRNGTKKSKEQLYMIYNNINEKEKQKIKQFEIENDPRTYQKKQPGVVINDPLYNFEDNEREGEYEVQSSTISLKEELNKLDHDSYENARYCSDLVSMYEGIEDRLSAQDKNELRKLINSTNDADTIAAFLAAKKSQDEDMEDPLSDQTPLCEDDCPCDDDDSWFYYKKSSDENDDAIDEDYQKMDDDWGDPYTTTEIERVLKKLTNNFTSEDGDLRTYYVQEKILAISVLKKYYNIVEVSDGRVDETSEPSWVISYADPKEDLNENLSMNEWYDSPEPDEDNADIFYEVYVVDPGEDISSVMPEVFHDEYEIGDAFDYAYTYALKQHNKGEKHVEIYRCYEDNIGVNRYLEETLYADSDLQEALHKPKSVLSMMKDDGSYKKIQNKILNILPEDSSDESIEITSTIDNGDGTYTVEFTATYKQDGKTEELKTEVLYSPETSTYLFYTDESLTEGYPNSIGDRYYRIDIKHVTDSDGFLTDYTWWYDDATGQNIFIFGDSELYTPGDTDPDWETDSEETAQEWWDNYVGPYDEEDFGIEENLNPINSVDLNEDIVFIVHVYESNDELEATDFLGDVKVTIPELIKQYGKGVINTAMKGITRQEVERNKGIPSNWEIGYLINHIASSKFHELNSDKYFVLGDKIEVENLYSLPDGIKLLQKKLGKMLLPRYDDLEEAISDLSHPEQEFDSAATSINSNKLPAIYSMVNFNEGDVVIDFGGGKFDNAVEYIKDKGATLLVYDPYNRSAEHNQEVLSILEQNGGADAAVNSNVLNVIKEPEARKAVLQNIKQLTKPGAPIYITVYEGRGDGIEGPTKSGYQLNRKTADYMDEIQEVFPNAKRKGKLIVATN